MKNQKYQFLVFCGSKCLVKDIFSAVDWCQAERFLQEWMKEEGLEGMVTRYIRCDK